MIRISTLLFLILLTACGGGGSEHHPPAIRSPTVAQAQLTPVIRLQTTNSNNPVEDQLEGLEGLTFEDFTVASFDLLLRRSPGIAVSVAAPDVPTSLDDISAAYQDDSLALTNGILEQLLGFESAQGETQVFRVYRYYLEDLIEAETTGISVTRLPTSSPASLPRPCSSSTTFTHWQRLMMPPIMWHDFDTLTPSFPS